MASIGHSLVMVLSGLLIAGGYSLPSRRLLGRAGDTTKARGLHATSPLVATGRWEWKTAGEASHETPPLTRGKRESFSQTTPETTPSPLLEDESTPPTMESTSPLFLEDETTPPSTELTTERLEEDETSQAGLAGSTPSTEVTATAISLEDASTEAAAAHPSTVRDTAALHGRMTTASLSEDFTETEGAKDGGRPSHTANAARPTSAAPSQASVATSAGSVATVGPGSKPSVKSAGSTPPSSSPPMTSSKLSPAVPVRPPSGEAPQGPDRMVGQCLLAIFLLALVAGIFIITTFVLAALLLRQRRAYKLRRRHNTEMVCISSLLAAEEAEASRERGPRAKRLKVLAQDGSETDIDNLTLNSFLPDH